MAIYDFKEFLNIDDVAEYLTDKGVYRFDIFTAKGLERFGKFLLQWVSKKEISLLHPFDDILIQYELDSNGAETNLKEVFIEDYILVDANTWLMITHRFLESEYMFPNWLRHRFYNNKNNRNEWKMPLDKKGKRKGLIININQILIPKYELDMIFNQSKSTKTPNLQQECLKSNQPNTLDENTKQSYLTTIGLLLELCQTKKYASQAEMITAISEFNIHGQGERTLQERFSQANTALSQARKK